MYLWEPIANRKKKNHKSSSFRKKDYLKSESVYLKTKSLEAQSILKLSLQVARF